MLECKSGARSPANTIGQELALNTYHYFQWPLTQKDTEKDVKKLIKTTFILNIKK